MFDKPSVSYYPNIIREFLLTTWWYVMPQVLSTKNFEFLTHYLDYDSQGES